MVLVRNAIVLIIYHKINIIPSNSLLPSTCSTYQTVCDHFLHKRVTLDGTNGKCYSINNISQIKHNTFWQSFSPVQIWHTRECAITFCTKGLHLMVLMRNAIVSIIYYKLNIIASDSLLPQYKFDIPESARSLFAQKGYTWWY